MLTRRDFIHAGCSIAVATLTASPARPFWHGTPFIQRQSVLDGFHQPDFTFKNLIKNSAGGWQTNHVGILDANGYLTSAPSVNSGPLIVWPSLYSGRYRLTWTGTGAFNLAQPATIYSGGALVSGLGTNTGFVNGNTTVVGNPTTGTPNGYVEFDFSIPISGAVDNGSGAIRLTVATTAISPNGATGACSIANVGGVPNATGQWTFVRIDSTHIDLVGSTFAGTYTSGGSFIYQPNSSNGFCPTGQTYSSFNNLALCRSSAPYTNDLTDVLTGDLSKCFNDDFISALSALGPGLILRFLDAAGINGCNFARTAYMTPVNSISYYSNRCPPAIWAGNTTGTDAYTIGSYPDMPVSWTDGETFQFKVVTAPTTMAILGAASNGGKIQFQVASTATLTTGQRVAIIGYNGGFNGLGNGIWTITVDDATHFTLTTGPGGVPSVFVTPWTSGGTVSTATIDCGSRGPKLWANGYGEAPSRFTTITNNTVCTAVYDVLQDCLLVNTGGLTLAWPYQVRVALCNKLGVSYWHQFPTMYDIASIATETAYIRDNLNSGLSLFTELSNEPWNTNFFQAQWLSHRGSCLGFTAPQSSGCGLYTRIAQGQVTSTWGGRSGLHRVQQWQAANFPTGTQGHLLEGDELNGSLFPLYAAAGYSNYNVAPNRPVDFDDYLAYAPYYNGAILSSNTTGGLNAGASGYSSADKIALQAAADNFASGNPSQIASAFAYMDNDIQIGTINGVLGTQTQSFLISNYYPVWQTAAAKYSKALICYEGGYQGNFPTSGQWNTVYGSGGSTYGDVGGLVYNLWLAYKKSLNFKATVRKQWNDQRVISPTLIPAWYTFGQNTGLTPTDRFSMMLADLYTVPTFFTSYNAMQDWNAGL